jgi:hypothetical protein
MSRSTEFILSIVFVFTTLEPFLKPIMKTATAGLSSASGEVIDSHDQYEVFNDPRAVSSFYSCVTFQN